MQVIPPNSLWKANAHACTDEHTSASEKLLAIDLVGALCGYCHGKLHTEIQYKVVKKKTKTKCVFKKMEREGNELLSLELTDYCPTVGGREEELTREWWGGRAGFTSRRWRHRLSEEKNKREHVKDDSWSEKVVKRFFHFNVWGSKNKHTIWNMKPLKSLRNHFPLAMSKMDDDTAADNKTYSVWCVYSTVV